MNQRKRNIKKLIDTLTKYVGKGMTPSEVLKLLNIGYCIHRGPEGLTFDEVKDRCKRWVEDIKQ